MARWRVEDSRDLYNVAHWGRGFFDVNEAGDLAFVGANEQPDLDLKTLVDELVERGIQTPILLRFPDAIRRRMASLTSAFQVAFESVGYQGRYRGVYPIKVNQQRHLVEHLVGYAREHHIGLEAGSRPELLIVLALLSDPEALIVCNGYKDKGYIETALLAQKLGRNPQIVIEKASEVSVIIEVATALGVRPSLGVRAKLSSPGKGKWKTSSGDRAKFGLTALQIVEVTKQLQAAGMLDCLRMLHFHIGSQVTGIRTFKNALREASRIYIELTRLGAPMGLFDVGGGLGVDYDGSQTDYDNSMNYSDVEYAADVVAYIHSACEEAEIPHPDIVSESGRSLVAYHSMLVFDVTGVEKRPTGGKPKKPAAEAPDVLIDMYNVYDDVNAKNYQSAWHDALGVREEGRLAFHMGLLDLVQFAALELLFWQTCGRIQHVMKRVDYIPDDMDGLEVVLADMVYGNFSLFQSVPDVWAIGQMFPVLPIQRLDEEPKRRAVVADLTCDSDGKLDRFIDRRAERRTLEVHEIRPDEPYYLGIALIGAYQEILGDLHNLFGDTNAAHISLDEEGQYQIDHIVEGDRVHDVLQYVQYSSKGLVKKVRDACEAAIRSGKLSRHDAKRLLKAYERGLDGYTYLGGEDE